MYPASDLHPIAAEALGVADGDWVSIETPRAASALVPISTTGSIPASWSVGEHGWWQACAALDAPG